MNDPRDKPPHSKHVNVKSKTRETQYLKYRSFKPKCVESRVAGYINTKKSRVDVVGTAAISASTRVQQHPHHHQPNQNVKASRSQLPKSANNSNHHQMEVPAESKKPKRAAKDHRYLRSDQNSNGKAHVDGEEKEAHKSETNIQTDLRKTHTQPKSKQRNHHQHKKYKTFDIASFPRVFSTSDLMEKMNEEPSAAADNAHEKCEFHNVDLEAAPTAQPLIAHAEDEPALQFRNEDVNIDITCHRSEIDDSPAFPHVDSMVFKCEQPMLDLSTPNSRVGDCHPQNCAMTFDLEPKLNDKFAAQNFSRENETLKTELDEKRNLIDELHTCVHNLRDELRIKSDIEEELLRSKDQLQKTQSEMNTVVEQNTKLIEELKKNTAQVELLSKRNEELAAEKDRAPQPLTTTLLDEEKGVRLRNECDSLRNTNAELLNDLRQYQKAVNRLETELDQQKKAVRMLVDVKVASANQLNAYQTEIAYLKDAKGKLMLKNQQLEARNKRLLNVLALNHVLSLSKQFPHSSSYGRSVTAPSFDVASNTSRKRNRLQEIKHFNTSCQKFTTTQ